MAALLLLLATVAGVVAGDLVLENPAGGEVTAFHHTISGYPQGWLLATAAALSFLAGLLLAASLSASRARRARRQQLRITPRHAQRNGVRAGAPARPPARRTRRPPADRGYPDESDWPAELEDDRSRRS
jgi:hypothetical protein